MAEASRPCPNCGAVALAPFYEVRGVPAHSVLLMSSREQAQAYPTGDVRLAWCQACGFITNLLFDAGLNEYSTTYEEVQTFSPTFNAFASKLVEHLVEERGIRGKHVVEIGCGKGEFLLELCERGGNRGIGIDPSYVAGRKTSTARAPVRFLNELYSAERHGGLPVDLLVCRHTLEHIQPTQTFLRTVRRSLGHREDVLVFFELPDTERVLEERAFWDIYYEHCSYFTRGSLACLFRDCGFEVLDLWKDYGDQYLLIEARPVAGGAPPPFPGVERPEDVGKLVAAFEREVPRTLGAWRERLQRDARLGRRAVIWGAGSKGVAFVTTLGIGPELGYAVDINPHKQGYFLPGSGHEVVGPERLREYRPDVVIAMNAIYREEIARQLESMGLATELLTV